MITFRLKRLVEKLLSFKFVIFSISTFLRIFGFIGNGEWLTIALFVIGGHVGMKTFYKVREGSYERTSSLENNQPYKTMEIMEESDIHEMAQARRKEVSDLISNSPAANIAAGNEAVRNAINSGIDRFSERCRQPDSRESN